MSTTVLLGNTAALMADGSPAPFGNTITEVQMREGFDDLEEAKLALSTANDSVLNTIAKLVTDRDRRYAVGILEVDSLWNAAHSSDPPEWVESDDQKFARALASWFSSPNHECVVGRPDGWEINVPGSDAPTLAGGSLELDAWAGFNLAELVARRGFEEADALLALRCPALLTNGGRDDLHAQHLGTAAPPTAFNYMAVSANAAAELATNTTLPGEITTAGGGLVRAQATYAHTVGTNTSTLTKTFTANATDALPVTLAKIGVFNALAAGRLGYEKLLSATATLSASGDNAAITFTLTAG